MNKISNIVISVLEFVEVYHKNISSDKKKEVALTLINEKINEIDNDDIKNTIASSINIIDELIDVIILASKNKIAINKNCKKFFSCITN